MMSRINRFLGRQFGAQHSGHQTDIKIRQHAAQVLLLRQNGRIGNHRSVRNHKKCHVKRKRKRRPVKRLPQRKRPALFFSGNPFGRTQGESAPQRSWQKRSEMPPGCSCGFESVFRRKDRTPFRWKRSAQSG